MRFLSKTALAFGLALLITVPALGQRGGGQPFDTFLARNTNVLLTLQDVQAELKLSDEQKKTFLKTIQEIGEKHKEEAAGLTKLAQEQNAKAQAYRKKVADIINLEVLGVLKADQVKRLSQIEMQVKSYQAFQQQEVAKALALTEQQTAGIKDIVAEVRKGVLADRGRRGDTALERRKKTEATNKAAMDKVVSLLTDDQKKILKDMLGEPLTRLQLDLARNRGMAMGGGGFRGGIGTLTARSLAANPFVQLELKLTDEQIDRIDALPREMEAKHKEVLDKAAEEMNKYTVKRAAYRKVLAQETLEALLKHLKPDQLKRYKQIDLQRRGNEALAEKDVQEELKLTDEQKADFKTIQDTLEKEIKQIQAAAAATVPAFTLANRIANLRKEMAAKMLAKLSEAQQKAWKEMNGAPFQLTNVWNSRFNNEPRAPRGNRGNRGQ